MSRILAAVACAAIAPAVMAGDVTFTFDDPAAGGEFQGVAGMPGALTYDTAAVLDLVVDSTDCEDGSVNVFQAQLEMELAVGTPTSFGGIISAPVNGTFTFTDLDSGDVIFTATTSNAQLVNFSSAGSVISSVDGTGSGLTFDAGPALAGLGIIEMMALDAVFTLTNISIEQASTIFSGIGGQNPVLNSFGADSAFTATAATTIVPTPGAVALAGIGLMGAVRRRRRN